MLTICTVFLQPLDWQLPQSGKMSSSKTPTSSSSTAKTSTKKSIATAPNNKKPIGDYRQNSFESRYSSIIAKQIMDNNVNHEELKRQLHIFMPYNSMQHKDITTKKIMMMNRSSNNSSLGDEDDDEDTATEDYKTTSDN